MPAACMPSSKGTRLLPDDEMDRRCHIYSHEDKIRFDFFIKFPFAELPEASSVKHSHSVAKRVRLERPPTDTLSDFFDRFLERANRLGQAKFVGSKFEPGSMVPFVLTGAWFEVNAKQYRAQTESSLTLDQLFGPILADSDTAPGTRASLAIEGRGASSWMSRMELAFNPAWLNRCRLDMIPIVGCPMLPLIECNADFCFEQSSFDWYLENDKSWSEAPAHSGRVFEPPPSAVGRRVQLLVRPRDRHGTRGLAFPTSTVQQPHGQPVPARQPVRDRPHQRSLDTRLSALPPRPPAASATAPFRVVSYNILADMYASSSLARTELFGHCPPDYIAAGYRLPLLLREARAYSGDVVCLQEVETFVFERYLQPYLAMHGGLTGLLVNKRLLVKDESHAEFLDTPKDEGVAIFYNPARFRLVETAHLTSLLAEHRHDVDVAAALRQAELDWPADRRLGATLCMDDPVTVDDFALHRFKCYSHAAAVGVFELTAAPGRFVVLANTHLYFHPKASGLRLVQSIALRNHLRRLVGNWEKKSGHPVGVVLCGDFNQVAESPGNLALTAPQPASALTFRSAYSEAPLEFTNWVPGFRAAIDHILVGDGDDLLKTVYTSPTPDRQTLANDFADIDIDGLPASSYDDPTDRFALPNAFYPSDHLALVADLAWCGDRG